MQAHTQTAFSNDDDITHNGLVARRLADDLSWGEGAIQPQAGSGGADAHRELVSAVLESLEPVDGSQAAYSACTDGRLPVRLLSGDPVPVREQMVGADMVSAFFVAEVLGKRFYVDPDAPVADRIVDVAACLHQNGMHPSSHVACGAAAGYVPVLQNAVRFGANPAYVARLQALLPEGMFDDELYRQLLDRVQALLDSGAYEDIRADMFLDAARAQSGEGGIAELKDDGRGVHGHMEEAIIRVQVDGTALNVGKLAQATGGRQVFGVNDGRMERVGRVLAREGEQDYRLARIALEVFADAAHGTLAKGLPTYVITAA